MITVIAVATIQLSVGIDHPRRKSVVPSTRYTPKPPGPYTVCRTATSYSASCMRLPAAATPLPPTQNNARAPHCHDAICGLSARYRHDRARQQTDQERTGATIAIARGDIACPARALREWLDAAGIGDGPIFRPIDKGGTVGPSWFIDRSVAKIVKAYAGRAGFDASLFSSHSLRAGFLTSAAGKGASIFKMMDVSRHKSVDTLPSFSRIMPERDCSKGLSPMPPSVAPTEASEERRGILRRRILCSRGLLNVCRSRPW